MIPLGLTDADQRTYEAALRASRFMRVRVSVLDRDEKPTDSLTAPTSRLLDGQISVDADVAPTRTASLTILDPERRLRFDGASPADGALYADRFLRVEYGVWVPDFSDWVDIPVFTGPLSAFRRDEAVVAIEAQGKESLGLTPAVLWRPMTIPKGTRKTTAIRRILRAVGERSFSIPDLKAKLPKPLSLGRNAEPWARAARVAQGMNRQLLYDGAGVARLRTIPETPVYTFRTGDGADVESDPALTFDMAEIRNVVQVIGDAPRGGKKRVRYAAVAPRAHPLSPVALSRNGDPRYLVEFLEETSIRSQAEARRLAERRLRALLSQEVQVSFSALPVPHLDPGDRIALRTEEFNVAFTLRQFVIPLTAQGTMSVGVLRRVRRPDRRGIGR